MFPLKLCFLWKKMFSNFTITRYEGMWTLFLLCLIVLHVHYQLMNVHLLSVYDGCIKIHVRLWNTLQHYQLYSSSLPSELLSNQQIVFLQLANTLSSGKLFTFLPRVDKNAKCERLHFNSISWDLRRIWDTIRIAIS